MPDLNRSTFDLANYRKQVEGMYGSNWNSQAVVRRGGSSFALKKCFWVFSWSWKTNTFMLSNNAYCRMHNWFFFFLIWIFVLRRGVRICLYMLLKNVGIVLMMWYQPKYPLVVIVTKTALKPRLIISWCPLGLLWSHNERKENEEREKKMDLYIKQLPFKY